MGFTSSMYSSYSLRPLLGSIYVSITK
jgi:hypothetical protein